jgi:FkbM family methyltransferase
MTPPTPAASGLAHAVANRVVKALGLRKLLKRLRPRRSKIRELLTAFARSTPDVFFIQVGSNDGVTGDPLHSLVRKYRWSGILIEPVGYIFERLVANYQGQPGLVFENVAVSGRNETRDFFRLPQIDDPDLPVWYDHLGSFRPEVIKKHARKIPHVEMSLLKERVVCVTLETLLRKHHVKKIDLVHVDTEGYDFEVIKQIDFQRYRPAVLLYEHKHLQADEQACASCLEQQGYELIVEEGDTLAVRGDWRPVGERGA